MMTMTREMDRQRGRVLVVEDDPDYAELLSAFLAEGGFEVMVANDGEEGLQRLRRHRPDLITLDIEMPRKGGLLFYRQLKAEQEYRGIPVLVVTGLTYDDPDMRNFIRSFLEVEHLPHPEAYLEKPVEMDDLLAQVRVQLASNS